MITDQYLPLKVHPNAGVSTSLYFPKGKPVEHAITDDYLNHIGFKCRFLLSLGFGEAIQRNTILYLPGHNPYKLFWGNSFISECLIHWVDCLSLL